VKHEEAIAAHSSRFTFHVSRLDVSLLPYVNRRAVAFVGVGACMTTGDRPGGDRQAQAQNKLL